MKRKEASAFQADRPVCARKRMCETLHCVISTGRTIPFYFCFLLGDQFHRFSTEKFLFVYTHVFKLLFALCYAWCMN